VRPTQFEKGDVGGWGLLERWSISGRDHKDGSRQPRQTSELKAAVCRGQESDMKDGVNKGTCTPPVTRHQPLLSVSRDVRRNATSWAAHNQKLGCRSADHQVFRARFGTPGLQESRLTNCVRTSEHAVMAMGLPSTFLIKSVGIHPPISTMLIHSLT